MDAFGNCFFQACRSLVRRRFAEASIYASIRTRTSSIECFLNVFLPIAVSISCHGKLHHEPRTLPFPFRFRPYLAAVSFDNPLRDVEAVTGGVNVCFYRLFSVSAFGEEILHIFRGNADAVVFDREAEVLGF